MKALLFAMVLIPPFCWAGPKAQDPPAAQPQAAQPAQTKGQASPSGQQSQPSAGVADPTLAVTGGSKPAGAASVDVKTYVIGAEDQIAVTVWDVPKLSAPYLVRPDGKITMPLIGDIQASGFTPDQLQRTLAEKLKEKYIQSPDVTVLVLQVNSKKYYIHGEVNQPGAYPLIVPTTVLEGLANGHGFRDFASVKKIRILRGTQQFRFNYKEVTQGKRTEQNIFLQPGDQIIVP
jgi:polysaccharide export outer membrane protein